MIYERSTERFIAAWSLLRASLWLSQRGPSDWPLPARPELALELSGGAQAGPLAIND